MLSHRIRRTLPAALLIVLVVLALSACATAAPTVVPAPTTAPTVAAQAPTVAAAPTVAPTAAAAPTTAATVAAAPTVVPTTGATTSATIPEVTYNAADFSFQGPDSIPAGLVRVKMVNQGQEAHHLQFLRLNDNVTFAQFTQALPQGEQAALALVSMPGGVGAINPGGATAEVVVNLTQGNYVLACFIGSPDGVPHLAKGMLKPIQVTAATGAAATLTADVNVTLKDFMIDMPSTFKTGMTTFKITNEGPEPHEWNLFQLAEGKKLPDVLAFFSTPPGSAPAGPPPFSAVGGMNGLTRGGFGYVQMDLKAGNYIAICNIPSFANQGKPHSELGMMKEFTVQ